MGEHSPVRSLLTGAVLRELITRSRWYRLAFVAALLGAALDGWLSPVVIPNHPETGELNAVSLFHVLDGLAFASVRVLAVVAMTLLVGIAVHREGISVWSHGAMALIAVVNYANGTIALSSGIAAAGGPVIGLEQLAGASLLAAGATMVASLLLVSRSRPSLARLAASVQVRMLGVSRNQEPVRPRDGPRGD